MKATVSYTTGIRREKMSADRNTSDAKGLLYSVYFKFVNSAKKKAAGAIPYLRCSSCVLAKNKQSITSFSCVAQRVPHSEHCAHYGAYGALHSERLSMLCGLSEAVCSDTLW